MPTTTHSGVVQRSVALSRIVTADGFNPRTSIVRDREFETLVATVRTHGVLQPIRVRETGDGDYVLIAGERRYAAAIEASLMEIPAVIRPVGDGDSAEEAVLLVEAVIENDVRVGLTCVQRALGYQRLRDGGLTVKGIAQQLGRSQRHVREHLQILDLPEVLRDQLDDGRLPVKTVAMLRELERAHAGLAVALVDAVGASAGEPEPWSWDDAIDRTFEVLADATLPDGVFAQHRPYPIDALPLTESAARNLATYTRLSGRQLSSVRLDARDVERASALGAVVGTGAHALILGSDVAAQLVADDLVASVKQARKDARQRAQATAPSSPPGAVAEDAAAEQVDSEADRIARERADRARDREQELQQRRVAEAFNERLGAALVKQLSRVKIDADALKVLTSVTVGDQLTQIAMRGARYGFPGWFTDATQKNATVKRVYPDSGQALAKAQEYLAGAITPGDHAGRVLAMLVMAQLADEQAVAASNRVHHQLTSAGTPWCAQVPAILDRLAATVLPGDEQLTALLDQRADAREQAAAAERRRSELQTTVADGLSRLEELSVEQVTDLRAVLEEAYGRYSSQYFTADRLLGDRLTALTATPVDGGSAA